MNTDKEKPVKASHPIDQWKVVDRKLLFRCPDCDTPVKVSAAGQREHIFCPACGAGLIIPSAALKQVSGGGNVLEITTESGAPPSSERGVPGNAPATEGDHDDPLSEDESPDNPIPIRDAREVIYTEIRPAPLVQALVGPRHGAGEKPEFPTIDRRPELKRRIARKRRRGGRGDPSTERIRVKKWRKQSSDSRENTFDQSARRSPRHSSRFVYVSAAIFLLGTALVIALNALPKAGNQPGAAGKGGAPGVTSAGIPIEDHVNKALDVTTAFLSAPNWEARLPLVYRSSRTYPLIKSYYSAHPDGPVSFLSVNLADSKSSGPGNYYHFSIHTQEPAYSDVVVTMDEDTPKVDWTATMEDTPLAWKSFINERPTDPTPFRVMIAQDNYYSELFPKREEHACFRIRGKGRLALFYAYAPANGDVARQILLELSESPDNVRAVRIKIRFPEEARILPRVRANQVEITEFMGAGWRGPGID